MRIATFLLLGLISVVHPWSFPIQVSPPPIPSRELTPPPLPKPNVIPIIYVEPQEALSEEESSREYEDRTEEPPVVPGPVHSYVKTDRKANFKWAVRHHLG